MLRPTKTLLLILLSIGASLFPLSAVGVTPEIAEVQTIVVPKAENTARNQHQYFTDLLRLALDKTAPKYGPAKIQEHGVKYTSARLMASVQARKGIDVMWTSTTEVREKKMRPVPIPLLRELNSYRVLLIREEDKKRFQSLESVGDLRKLKAGFVNNWPETVLFLKNGFPVVTTSEYENLFSMLAGKRFDYLPRGLYEVWDELEAHKDKQLVIEDSIMLYYKAPFHFFVSSKNSELAERIEEGLKLASEDGSFEALFLSVPAFKRGQAERLNSSRRLFHIDDNS